MGSKTRIVVATLAGLVGTGAALAESKPGALELSYRSAIERSLAKNFQIQVEKYNPKIAVAKTTSAAGQFDPVIGASITYDENRRSLRSLDSTDDGTANSSDSGDFASSSGVEGQATVSGLTPWGLTYSVGPSLTRSTNSQSGVDEVYNAFLGGSITQPLLKGFGTDVNLAQIRIARADQAISVWGLRQRVMDVVTDTINVYNDLYFAIENLEVERRSLNLAKQTLHDNQRRAEIGVMSPLDIVQAQADEADREGRVITAERTVADTKNFLKQLVTDQVESVLETDVAITPPPFDLQFKTDEENDLKRVFDLRPDYRQALLDIQKRNINVVFTRNQTYPQLDLVASLGLNGIDTNAASSIARIGKPSEIAGTVGGVFSLPVPNRTARGNLEVANLEVARQLVALKQLEQNIYVTVDNAAGQISTTRKLIDVSRAAREYAARTLEAAQARLTSGTATTFEVLQFQRDLATAETNEVRALTAHQKAIAAYALLTGTTLERNRIKLD